MTYFVVRRDKATRNSRWTVCVACNSVIQADAVANQLRKNGYLALVTSTQGEK